MSLNSAKACSQFLRLRLFYDCSIQKVLLHHNSNNNNNNNDNNKKSYNNQINHDHNHNKSNINSIMPIFEISSRVKGSLMPPGNHNNFYQRS